MNALLFTSFTYGCLFMFVHGQLVQIHTSRGPIVGYHQNNGNGQTWYGESDVFLGVPYALPPVGNLRYKPPRPLIQFPGSPSPYNATHYRLQCVQPTNNLSTVSEDCLFMTIVSPNVSTTSKYPVMMFIHGGSLTVLNSQINIGGVTRNYATRGIVVISIDYRLGWLGLFTTITNDFPPNLGMLDMVEAIKFINSEITYFGGDPNRITIFGQSAGAFAVSAITYSPLATGLFQQVIMESGDALTCYEACSNGVTNVNPQFAQNACNFTQQMWDSGDFTSLIACLQNISIEDGLRAQERTGAPNAGCWDIVQDNYFFPDVPQVLYKNRPNIPVIIGNCRDEMSFYEMDNVKHDPTLSGYTRQSVEPRLLQRYAHYGNQTAAIVKIMEQYYMANGTADDDHLAWAKFVVAAQNPMWFTMPSLRDIQNYIKNGNPNLYTYEFDWASVINDNGNPIPTEWNPVGHGCETNFVFSYGDWNSTDRAIGDFVQLSWSNFAIHGKPSLNGTWTPTTSKNWTTLEYFAIDANASMRTGFRAIDQVVWNEVTVGHTCELNFVFSYGDWSAADKAIGDLVQESWSNFAIHGKPSLNGTWTPTTSKNWTTLEYFAIDANASMRTGFRAIDQVVWNEIIPSIAGETPPALPETAPLCPRGYAAKVKNFTCYEAFGSTSMDWLSSQSACNGNSYGSLVSIDSAFENSDLLNYAKTAYPSCTGFYIGLYQSQFLSNPNWTWVNYDTKGYRNWKSGYPMADANSRCVVLNANDGTWTNQACDQTQCYICSNN